MLQVQHSAPQKWSLLNQINKVLLKQQLKVITTNNIKTATPNKLQKCRVGRKHKSTTNVSMPQQEMIDNVQVFNLSAKNFSDTQLQSKGLYFSPTYHFNLYKTILDVNKFVRDFTVNRHFAASISHRIQVIFNLRFYFRIKWPSLNCKD